MTSGTSGQPKTLPFTQKQKSSFFLQGITVVYGAMFRCIPNTFRLQKTLKIMFTPTVGTTPLIDYNAARSSPTSLSND